MPTVLWRTFANTNTSACHPRASALLRLLHQQNLLQFVLLGHVSSCHSYPYTECSNRHANKHPNRDADRDTDGHTNQYVYHDANANRDPNTDNEPHPYTHVYPKPHTIQHQHADGCPNHDARPRVLLVLPQPNLQEILLT
jgi:hypothetical protein